MSIYLRPHHGLCMILFSEEGHSAAYASAIREHMEELNENPQTEVVLGLALDDMCGVCPHNSNSICGKSKEVDISDGAILSYCGLTLGDKLSWEDFRQRLIDNIISKGLLKNTCETCKYLRRCSETAKSIQ